MQVPAANSEAVKPSTVQTAGVDDVKLTCRPDVAVAVNASEEATGWVGIALKLIDCWVVPVAVPLSGMV